MSGFPAIRGASTVLAHVPGLVEYGSKPAREIAADRGFRDKLAGSLRSWEAARDYLPHQVFLGSHDPDVLRDRPRPWWNAENLPGERPPFGVAFSEIAAFGLLAWADRFGLVRLERETADRARTALCATALFAEEELERLSSTDTECRSEPKGALPLRSDGRVVGCVQPGHEEDASLSAEVLLENLAAKATAAAAVRVLLAQHPEVSRSEIGYVIGTGEEAVGDRYQRGGGNLGKAVAEQAGLLDCSGSDVKAFCCGPLHGLVMAGALVQSGVYPSVLVVGGGSLAKLGMKCLGHLKAGMPALEDVLAGFAVLVGPPDGRSPVIRLDAVGKHDVRCSSAAARIAVALSVAPLARLGRTLLDVDRYAVELHNPEITEPGGSGDVPRSNYRVLAALAVRQGLIAQDAMDAFERERGLVGFSPTQGHVASAIPYLGHALRQLQEGRIRSAMFIAKGSLFLGKMTELADGLSFILERP